MLKGITVTAPVLLTLPSRRVWGADGNCTISAMTSANLSRPERTASCEGCTPGYWMNNPGQWPETFDPGTPYAEKGSNCFNKDGTPFHADYLFEKSVNANFADLTLMQVMRRARCKDTKDVYSDPFELGFHAAAALLNAADPRVEFGYGWSEIVEIYNARVHDDQEGLRADLIMLNERYCPLAADDSL
ncbi:hypothetical protein [Sediminicurvatus halobius]|uniref:hypothetical protein n=1 Tax=Sediminicurvatus halobius TaxID=2182432 RepID=UPI001304C038|nr:hypothetical protein [Spiribacter halobius]